MKRLSWNRDRIHGERPAWRQPLGLAAHLALSTLALLTITAAVGAQGVQTGQLRGVVQDENGAPLPGVSITAESAALQGARTAFSTSAGDYILRALPPGLYTVRFELEGMDALERTVQVAVGAFTDLDATLGLSVSETIVVQAAASPLDTSEITYNITQEDVDEQAVTRDLDSIADLAPGLTLNTPNTNQITVNGSFAYDNVWLMEGVEINDNIFGSFDNLFIEDAILETQVLTSGISAEYGRFSGGVVNVITKSGGNEFAGSLRVDLTNNDWQERNPFEVENEIERTDKTNDIWQGTLGGRIVRDRLWFFAAARLRETADEDNFDITGIGFDQVTENDRFEGKLTATPATGHSISLAYMENDSEVLRKNFAFTIDPETVFTQTSPNDLAVLRYHGTIGRNGLIEAHYSEKEQRTTRGGASTDIRDSPFLSFGFVRPVATQHYNGTYFDANDPENRDNEQLAASYSLFHSSDTFGSHDLKFGVEDFTNINVGGNSQSPTGLVFLFDYEIDAQGAPVFDAQGRLVPVFELGFLNQWLPARGSRLETRTVTAFVNDRWQLNEHWAFNLGVRYETVDSEATGDIVAVDTDRVVPRLGATYDLFADGRYVFDAGYAEYSGGYNPNIVSSNSNVGNPSLIQYLYVGPPGSGRDFDPGFDLANYVPVFARFPSANVFFDGDLKSPVTQEITLGFGARLGNRGFAEINYVDRDTDDLIENFITFDLGRTTITDPITLQVDNQELRNTDLADRTYRALQLSASYRLSDRWDLAGNYTHQLENEGNYVGEATNQPAIQSSIGTYPEILDPQRNFPFGRLPGFQRHKLRAWTSYVLPLGELGNLTFGGLLNYDSGTSYSLVDTNFPVTAQQLANDPGYAGPPTTANVFFGERGSQSFEDFTTIDLAVRYGLEVFGGVEPWVKVEVFNVLDEDKLIVWDTNVSADTNGPTDSLGLPLQFIEGPNFGRGTQVNHYVQGRELRLSLGIRF
ncbi:MAG: hypothetical protein DWQ36_20050 [Acidobacteria bacterium]|mgnify:FL=1|nr:MAG: hypothetical protein DWQ30_08315 [Acidobacteriota bacterium]REK03582.1 MAG: hypothetical protein DWQ36_20050 [Acidobacteriota bacterium]